MSRLITFALLLAILCTGCKENKVMPTEVARVNGEWILFADLEDRRTTLTGYFADSLDTVNVPLAHWQYRRALQQMIVETLVAQYMSTKKILLPEDAVSNFEKVVRQDYGQQDFDMVILEQGISLEQWRSRVRSMLLVDLFKAEVLRPQIRISAEEVEAYYNANKEDFIFSEQWRFLQVSSLSKDVVELASKELMQSKNPISVKGKFNVSIREINIEKERLPEGLLGVMEKLVPWQASSVQIDNNEYMSFILLEKQAPVTLDLIATYDRVEQMLAEGKMEEVFATWVSEVVKKSDIFIHPYLLQSFEDAPVETLEQVSPEPKMTEEEIKNLPAEP